jgi:DNA repair exonuclease SbcCD ATPase subunit
MPIDPDPLPTLADDEKIQALRASIESLADDLDAATEALPEAKEDVDRLTDELDELEVEQYADPDLSESDVEAKRQELQEAKERVQRLQTEREKKREALDRVRERLKEERTAAGRRLYADYVEAEQSVAAQVARAAKGLRTALENANAVRQKARSNNVEPGPGNTDPHLRRPTGGRVKGVDSRYDDVLMTLIGRLIEEEEEQASEFDAVA